MVGLGAFASPLVATQFAPIRQWSFHYLVSLSLAVMNAILLSVMFKFKRHQGKLTLFTTPIRSYLFFCIDLIAQYHDPAVDPNGGKRHSKKSDYKAVLSNRNVYLLAIFCFIYAGECLLSKDMHMYAITHGRSGSNNRRFEFIFDVKKAQN